MNLRYELKIIDLDVEQNDSGLGNVIEHVFSSDIKDVDEALDAHKYELDAMLTGQDNE